MTLTFSFLASFLFAVPGCFLFELSCVFGFYEVLEAGQIRAPEAPILLEPGVDGAKRLGVEVIDAVPSFAVLADKMRASQQTTGYA